MAITTNVNPGASPSESDSKSSVPTIYLPKSDNEFLADSTILVQPLQPPQEFEIQYLKPGIHCRWVNFKAQEGHHFDKMVAMGYVPATPSDVKTIIQPKDGKFVMGDVILMKIEERKYASAMKSNVVKAQLATGKTIEEATRELQEQALKATGGNPAAPSITPFAPSDKELEKLTGATGAKVVQSHT